ncbi:hypothetical protein M9H77_20935 [Catharanthus roseus]|uniref:Uncharacterized protein n=1 Tax=Catharanthus roseus TaxID=4058 RepID=A0ACC0AME0_CATRO|nr:hypothetical protein M9H77_20935 [Catharanthus roseus]
MNEPHCSSDAERKRSINRGFLYSIMYALINEIKESTEVSINLVVCRNAGGATSVEISACSENREADDFLNDLQELGDEDLDDNEKSGIYVDMSKEPGKSKGEACLTTIVKGDILTKGTKLVLETMTLKHVIEETTKTNCLAPEILVQGHERYKLMKDSSHYYYELI